MATAVVLTSGGKKKKKKCHHDKQTQQAATKTGVLQTVHLTTIEGQPAMETTRRAHMHDNRQARRR